MKLLVFDVFFSASQIFVFKTVVVTKPLVSGIFKWAPTSICYFIHLSIHPCTTILRNHTSCNHDFWYTCVKWWYFRILGPFYAFLPQQPKNQNFDFWVVGVKMHKMGQNGKKNLSVSLLISGTIPHWIVVFSTYV